LEEVNKQSDGFEPTSITKLPLEVKRVTVKRPNQNVAPRRTNEKHIQYTDNFNSIKNKAPDRLYLPGASLKPIKMKHY
jgi:hypothetical protein